MKFLELIWLAIRWSILLVIVALIMTPWTTKNGNLWISQSKQKEEQNSQVHLDAVNKTEQKTQPIYKTFGTVKLKEVYKYPKHGFYVYEFMGGDTTELAFFDNMAQQLKYSNANFLTIFIYDKEIDEAPFWNAPKQAPGGLIIEADKQKPFMYFVSAKDLMDQACDRWGLDYFYRNQRTNWKWLPDQEKDTSADYCKY